MPGSWSKLRDVAELADERTELEFALTVGELSGLPAGVAPGNEPLRARIRFHREQGLPAARVALEGSVTLVCQRCLEPMRQQVDVAADVLIVDSETAADRGIPDRETFLAADGRLSCEALIAEELLLSLPLVPRHDDEQRCEMSAADRAGERPAAGHRAVPEEAQQDSIETQRPFAELRTLLKERER